MFSRPSPDPGLSVPGVRLEELRRDGVLLKRGCSEKKTYSHWQDDANNFHSHPSQHWLSFLMAVMSVKEVVL